MFAAAWISRVTPPAHAEITRGSSRFQGFAISAASRKSGMRRTPHRSHVPRQSPAGRDRQARRGMYRLPRRRAVSRPAWQERAVFFPAARHCARRVLHIAGSSSGPAVSSDFWRTACRRLSASRGAVSVTSSPKMSTASACSVSRNGARAGPRCRMSMMGEQLRLRPTVRDGSARRRPIRAARNWPRARRAANQCRSLCRAALVRWRRAASSDSGVPAGEVGEAVVRC